MKLALAGFLLGSLMLAIPQPSKAATVAAVECAVNVFPCPAAAVIAAGVQSNGVNLLLGNQYTIMPFAFANADVTFTGTMLATDVAGQWIYNWGTGTATDTALAPPPGGFFLDIAFTQAYVTLPGPAVFNDMIVGTCGGGPFANSGAIAQGVVNATGLSVLGPFACGGALPFNQVGVPVPGTVGLVTALTGVAQFFFDSNGALGQSITLPWGDDFPDPAFNFNDPLNPLNEFTLDNLSLDPALTPIPEPGTFLLLGLGLGIAGLWRRRRS